MEGPTGQVLWDAGQCTSVDDLIRLLRSRFGSLNEEERYRSELKARRRRPSESLRSVYQDVRRLMALAFPGQSGSMWKIMTRDAFVDSLGDPALRFRVLERDPTTLEEALKVASRLEALGSREGEENWDEWGRRRNKFTKTAAAKDDDDNRQHMTNQIRELRRELEENRGEIERLRRGVLDYWRDSECVAGAPGGVTFTELPRPAQISEHPFACGFADRQGAPPMVPSVAPPAPPGHVVSSRGIEPDPQKISCIATWPEPRTLTEMRSFLGITSYYKNFVENFSEVARPLYDLTEKGARFLWDERCQQAFDTLKTRLCSAPVLATLTPDGDFVLDVDASTRGAGAILHASEGPRKTTRRHRWT